MSLKTCKDCGGSVSKNAPTCPHCGKPRKRQSSCASLGCLGLLLLIIMALWAMPGDSSRNSAPPPIDSFNAQVDCEHAIKQRLKAPGSAKFAKHHELGITGSGDGPYTVRGWVDSQNAFGAMIRARYACVVKYEGQTVHVVSLDIE